LNLKSKGGRKKKVDLLMGNGNGKGEENQQTQRVFIGKMAW